MADFVKLTKHGIVSYEWNPDTQTYVPSRRDTNNIPNLRLRCEIDDGVTLGDVFAAVQADPDLMEFLAQYSWCSAIEKFHAQARRPFIENSEVPEAERISHLEISFYGEFGDDYEKKDGVEEFEGIHASFSGITPGINWSVSCTPTNELAHLPIKIVPTIQFSKAFKEERVAKYNMSLLEVLDAIYWDISFYGGPEENEEFMEMLKGRIDEIKSGEATTVPLDCDTIEE